MSRKLAAMQKHLLGILVVLGAVHASAMVIGYPAPAPTANDYLNNRFYTGANKAFIGDPYDWSGVGKRNANSYAVTMISPSFFVGAAHTSIGSGNSIVFYEDNTTSSGGHSYTVSQTWRVYDPTYGATDLIVGKLVNPIPVAHNIAYYPIFMMPAITDYISTGDYDPSDPVDSFFMYGANNGWGDSAGNYVGRNRVDDIFYAAYSAGGVNTTQVIALSWQAPNGVGAVPYESRGQAGDSGSPSFYGIGSYLGLFGIHSAVPSPYGMVDIFLPFYVNEIQAVMANPAQGNSSELLTLLNYNPNPPPPDPAIPEPASGLILCLAASLCLGIRHR